MINKFLYPFGGVESVMFAEKELLEARGHRVVLFGMQHPDNVSSPWSEYFVSRVDYADRSIRSRLRSAARALYSVEARRKLRRLLSAVRPDVAHVHHIYHQITPSVLFELHAAGIPTVQTIHDYKPICPNAKLFIPRTGELCFRCKGGRFYQAALNNCGTYGRASSVMIALEAYFNRLTRIYLRAVQRFLTPSAFLRDRLVEEGMPADRVEVLPNFVELRRDARDDIPVDQPPVALFVGRLERYKGIHLVLAAAQHLSETQFVLIGTGSEEAALRQQAQSLPNVRVLGRQPRHAVREWMRRALCLLVPSLWHDVAPQVVLEAFAAGLPVIATSLGGLPDLVQPGVNGLLLEAPTADSLVAGVHALISNPALRHHLSIGARRTAQARFTSQHHYQGLMRAYAQARQACAQSPRSFCSSRR
ncbi:MAG: glycosyltransferase [Anaerolineae bacterium]|nr:glycosyltransferase [Anaerolineae bacterium]